jgi:CHAD domain-containing protein
VETNPQMRPEVPVPPPPGVAVAAFVPGPEAFPSSSILPLPRLPAGAEDPAAPPGSPVATMLPFVPRRLPATVGATLAAALEERWKVYRKELRRCQKEYSEDAVHELRVATRRLLAQLTLLGCVVPSASLEKARRILKRRLAALGDLRDTQVQLGFVVQRKTGFPELAPLGDWLRQRERRFAKSASRKVNGLRTRKLGKWIAAMRDDLAVHSANSRARKQLAAAVMRATAGAFDAAAKRRHAIDPADMKTVHQTRVAFKRFRYMMESLSPGVTGLSKRQLRVLAYYQRRMGIIQDLEVMQRCVARFVRERRKAGPALRPFCRYLRQRRVRALRSFLKSADRLLEFWPPARLAAPTGSALTRNAA